MCACVWEVGGGGWGGGVREDCSVVEGGVEDVLVNTNRDSNHAFTIKWRHLFLLLVCSLCTTWNVGISSIFILDV